MKQIVDVPEGYIIKVVKEDVEPKNSNGVSANHFEFNGVVFKSGDVIIRDDDGTMGIIESIQKKSYTPLPFLPPKEVDVPFVYAAFVPSNEKGGQIFINMDESHYGIGKMEGYRHATDEEKAKMLEVMQEEKHFSYDFHKNEFKYIPTVGDVCILWDNGHEDEAIIAELADIENGEGCPYKSSNGYEYGECVKYLSDKQYKIIIHEEE